MIARIYAELIRKEIKKLEDVPPHLQKAVQEELDKTKNEQAV